MKTSIDKIFPALPTNRREIKIKLDLLEEELSSWNPKSRLGTLHTEPTRGSMAIWKRFIKYNPNNLGNWSYQKGELLGTKKVEREVILTMIDLYGESSRRIEGYLSSGGTESNLFSIWTGRKYLKGLNKKNKICLLRTSLTHYSITKAADICNIPDYLVPLNREHWNMDKHGLEQEIIRRYRNGYRGFLIPLTTGYTLTGTSDDINGTIKTIEYLNKKLKHFNVFIWIDAALNGLIAPFVTNDFKPFASSYVQTVVVDFHKFGLVPYPAGIILYRKNLRKLIEKTIDYLPEKDSTIAGSRTGISAIAIWAQLHLLGKSGYRYLTERQIKNKKYFIKSIQAKLPGVKIITDENSLSCGLIFNPCKNKKLPINIENKYGLYAGKIRCLFYPNTWERAIIYKFFFLPHTTKTIVGDFIYDVSKYLEIEE